MKRFLLIAGTMILGLAAQAGAAIYSYRDEQGRLFLTDSPPNKKYKIVVTSKKETEGLDSGSNSISSITSTSSSQKFLLPSDESYSEYINEAASTYGVDPYLIKSVIKVESDFDPDVMSNKGAQGLMQLMPATAKTVGCRDPFNARDNILGGTNYLRMMLKRYNGSVDHVLAAYNAGPGNVDKYNGIPPFRETKNYVRKVKHYYEQYASAAGVKSSSTRKSRIIPVIHSDLNNRLTEAYEKFNAGDISGAMTSYRNILNLYPRNTQALYNLACLLDMERCYDEAIDVYKASLKQDPFLDKALYNMAVIYERMGMNTEAIKTWKKYVQVTKDEDKIVMAEKFIQELKEYASLN